MILAIDPGTKCGWALHDGARVVESGTWDLSLRRGDSRGMRYVYLRAKLNAIGSGYGVPDLVVVEQAHHRGGAATEYAYGVSTRVEEWCADFNAEHTTAHGATVKKFATGKGNAGKPAMVAAAEKRWPGHQCVDDNEADARWIAEWAAEQYGAAA